MKQVVTMALVIGMGTLILTGCNETPSDNPAESEASKFSKSIAGTWLFDNSTGCHNGSHTSSYHQIVFNTGSFTMDNKYYSELNCTEDALDKSSTITYDYVVDTNISGKTADETTMYALDMTVTDQVFHKGTFTGNIGTGQKTYGAIGKEKQKLILSWDFIESKTDRDNEFKNLQKIHNNKMAQFVKKP